MAKIILSEEEAFNLAEEKAKEITEIYEKAKEKAEQILDDLGIKDSVYAPELPEDLDKVKVSEDIETALGEEDSEKFEIKK